MNRVAFNKKIIIIASRIKNITKFNAVNRHRSNNFSSVMLFLMTGLTLLLISCNQMGKTGTNETATRGNIKISADESFQPIIETEIFTFTHLYNNAQITPQFKPEYDVINDFMNDSVRTIVTSKKLTDYQIQYLRDTQIIARTTTFAYDALALIISPENKDTLLTYNTVKNIFTGKITKWKEINPKSKLGDIRIIFDNNKSGNIRYFKELFGIKDSLKGNFFAVNSNPDVINFVSRNPDAIGILSINWISDKDNPSTKEYSKKIRQIAVSEEFTNDGTFYYPEQGWIHTRSYPFVREVYLITRETFPGLGSGFVNWAAAEQGQRIVLKSGLVPATMPIRLVQVKK